MKITTLMSDQVVLTEIGQRLTQRRFEQGLTQSELAGRAGVAKRTVEPIEAGASAQMSNMIRVMRVLELLPGLNQLLPETVERPMDLLRRKGKMRRRASSRKTKEGAGKPWTWEE
jgi:transcriptional regulator with XRE-family HTH domain